MVYQILSFIVPLFTIPYLSRILGAEGLGVYSYTNSIATYFTLFSMLGLNNYGVRAIAMISDDQVRVDKTFSQIFLMQFIFASIVLIFYLGYIFFFTSEYSRYLFLLIFQVASALVDVNWYFFGREKFKITVIRNSVIKILTLVFIFTLVHVSDDLWIYVLIHAVSIFLSAIVLWPSIFKEIHLSVPKLKDSFVHFKPSLIMFIPVVAVSVYKYMDKIMLGTFSIEETGYYENVEKILTVVLGLVTAFGTVMLPRISNLIANNDKKQADEYMVKSMDFIMFLSVGMACGMYALADNFVPLYFGEGFIRSVLIMQSISVTAIFTSWANVIRTQYLIPYRKDNIYIISVIMGAVVNFVGNVIFIPKFGAMGAVIGTILAEFVVAFVQTYASKKDIQLMPMFCNVGVYFAIGCIMILAIRISDYFLDGGVVGLVIEVFIGGVLYLLLAYLYKHFKNGGVVIKMKN